jgi:glycosyltransferase involved in cell wall biosynthesis
MSLSLFNAEVLGKLSLSNSGTSANVVGISANKPVIRVDPSLIPSSGIIRMDPSISNTKSIPAPAIPGKKRVMLCGTYPIGQSNGYSRVVYYICKYLGIKDDIILTIYGFQNFKQTAGSHIRNDIPSSVILHDAAATEDPKRGGFGEKEIGGYLKANPQDVVIIFNDMVITSACVHTIVNELSQQERQQFKLVSYMDQVYPYQKKQYIQMLNTYFDAVIAFTPYWRTIARTIGLEKRIPCYVFPHGFDHNLYYPIPRKIARTFYNIPENAFAILNLNRNQPRKRWDHTMMAFALTVKNYYDLVEKYKAKVASGATNPGAEPRPLRLVIGTIVDASWNLLEVLEHELMLLGVPLTFGQECIIAIANPQQLSDSDINVLYNACDIGLNTCEGEGFGLCQIEHLALGCPQVCQKIGGLQEFLNENNSILVDTKWRYYIDKHRDGIGGISEVGDTNDYAAAIWKYYTDKKLYIKHANQGRSDIIQHYKWETVVDHMHRILQDL